MGACPAVPLLGQPAGLHEHLALPMGRTAAMEQKMPGGHQQRRNAWAAKAWPMAALVGTSRCRRVLGPDQIWCGAPAGARTTSGAGMAGTSQCSASIPVSRGPGWGQQGRAGSGQEEGPQTMGSCDAAIKPSPWTLSLPPDLPLQPNDQTNPPSRCAEIYYNKGFFKENWNDARGWEYW